MNGLSTNLLKSCLKLEVVAKFREQYTGCKQFGSTRLFFSSPLSLQKDAALLPTPQEVTSTLRRNEFTHEFGSGSVKSYDSNQLASNDPIEDTRSEALCKMIPGVLMGVYDGHGGPMCAQVVSTRILNYIAAALLPLDKLHEYVNQEPRQTLLQTIQHRVKLVDDLNILYENSFKKYLDELLVKNVSSDVAESLEKSILELDWSLSREVREPFEASRVVNPLTLSAALSGAVACVAYVHGPSLHVANVGDCGAVLGSLHDSDHWVARKITKDHNADNYEELKRIWSEHPHTERKTVIKRDRLLGELAPLRSLGDYRYKWPAEVLSQIAVPLIGDKAIPANYHTPPYLTAKPDVYYHRLTQKDKFLIIASDGLWDMLTPLQAVMLVGEHMKGKVFLNRLKLPKKEIKLGEIECVLRHRREGVKSKPLDVNAATHLIRHAVGGTEYGVDETRLAHLLTLPPDVSRMFRDDITVTVAYFDSHTISKCPA